MAVEETQEISGNITFLRPETGTLFPLPHFIGPSKSHDQTHAKGWKYNQAPVGRSAKSCGKDED